MKKLLLFMFLLSPILSLAQVTFNANGNGGFGSPLGGGNLQVSDDGTTISFTFTKGAGDVNDGLVIYIDSETGGSANTSSFTDVDDYLRKAISGFDGGNRSTVNFPNGFNVDFAIALTPSANANFGGLWNTNEGSSHTFVSSVNLTPNNNVASASYTFSFSKTDLGLSGAINFKFVATYLNANSAFRSNEAIGEGLGGENPGQSTITFTSYAEYPVGSQIPDNKTQDLAAYKGFRLLASPVTTTFASFLTPIWTQGATGGDVTNGSPNVWTWNNEAAGFATGNWVANTDLTASSLSGASGLLVYDYDNDDFAGGQDNAITQLSVTGSEKSAPDALSLNENELGYTLIGNPFASAIDWSLLAKFNVVATAHIWNPTGNDAGSWEDITGTDKIAAFQGFLVRTSTAGAASLTIDAADKTTGATFLGKRVSNFEVKLAFESDSYVKNVRLLVDENATLIQDKYDSERLMPLATNFLDAYFEVNDKAFSINSLPLLSSEVAIPLHLEFTKSGTVTLSAKNFNLPNGYELTLFDNSNGSSHEITSDFSYQFDHVIANKSIAQTPAEVVKNKLLPGITSKEARFTLVISPIITSVEELSSTPTSIRLNQNYPNPFNPSTEISFELPNSMEVKLQVFDMLGREVATLVNGVKNAGISSAVWNAANASTGVYFYRLQTGSTVITKKMMLVK